MAYTNENLNSRELEREIDQKRCDMDQTLREIGDRLHPKRLLDEFVGMFRESDGASRQCARDFLSFTARQIKEHPVPALLAGTAVVWYLTEDEENKYRPWRTRRVPLAPWEEGYDWSTGDVDEPTWSERARSAIDQMRTILADQTTAAKDKLVALTDKMFDLSGRKREEIRKQMHAQWADIPEHSGSFVDARTGEPYDDSYGEGWEEEFDQQWGDLAACAVLARSDGWSAEQEGWSEKAQEVVQRISDVLAQSGASVRDQLRAVGGHLKSLARGSQRAAGRYQQAAGRGLRNLTRGSRASALRARDGMQMGAQRASQSVQVGARRARESVHVGYAYTRDKFTETLETSPLALGAACLGLGLIAGLALPATRAENKMMGDASDRLKDQARQTGREVLQRGQQAALAGAAAVTEEAERRGLTPTEIGHAAKRAVSAGAQAVKEEVAAAVRK